jgi:hypothetical protein
MQWNSSIIVKLKVFSKHPNGNHVFLRKIRYSYGHFRREKSQKYELSTLQSTPSQDTFYMGLLNCMPVCFYGQIWHLQQLLDHPMFKF